MKPTTKMEIFKFISASSIAFAIMSIGYLLFFINSGNKEAGFWSVIFFVIGLVLYLIVDSNSENKAKVQE